MKFIEKDASILAPLFLACSMAIAMHDGLPLDLLFIALAGYYMSVRYQTRGFCYSLALLAIGSAGRHFLFVNDHLFQLGLEMSFGLSFFVAATSQEEQAHHLSALERQIETGTASMTTLEEDMAKVQQTAMSVQMGLQTKVDALQKELEDLQLEHSSILMLNEVLRKTTAQKGEQQVHAQMQLAEAQSKLERVVKECEALREDASRAHNYSALSQENAQLIEELNAARTALEQEKLLAETHQRLFTRETLKAQDLEKEAAALLERLHFALQELDAAHKATAELHQVRLAAEEVEPLRKEVASLSERLELADKVSPEAPSKYEPMYRQLRSQFEEKNKLLHEVRSDLFRADTELQRLRMEHEQLQLDLVPRSVEHELTRALEMASRLEEENRHLSDLISQFTNEKKK